MKTTNNTIMNQHNFEIQPVVKKLWRSVLRNYAYLRWGAFPLIGAVSEGSVKDIKFLLGLGFRINEVDDQYMSPLLFAICLNKIDMAIYLMDKGANIHFRAIEQNITPLLAAVIQGKSLYLVEKLLDNGASINMSTADGYTPLILAAQSGNLPLVSILLEHDACADLQTELGKSALQYAVVNGDSNIVKLLLNYSANPNVMNCWGQTPLMFAAIAGNIEIVRLLLDFGAEVHIKSTWNQTALKFAILSGNREIEKLLRQHGATE